MTKRYDLLDRLGEGGAGAVFKAWDTRLQRYVAIKRLLPEDQRESDGVGTDLKKEAAALSALQHPNIVSVYDLDEIDGEPVVIMEFLNGETLEQTMRRGALNIGDFASVARQALEGLVAAHRLGVQHRDIKPSNIMVNWLPNGDFLVKVLDFGLADFTAKPKEATAGDEDSAYGSVHFMAPEQFTRQPVDARTDIYSLGCVFYYALTSAFPFTGRKMEDIIDAHLKTLPQPLMKLRQDIPKGLADWIAWLMNRDPEKRPQSAEEALEAFRLLQAGKTVKTGPQATGVRHVTGPIRVPQGTSSSASAHTSRKVSPVLQKKSSSKPILLALLAVGGIAAAGLVWKFMSSSSENAGAGGNGQNTAVTAPPSKGLALQVVASTGLKKNFGSEPAKLGDKIDFWQDLAAEGGPNHLHYINTNITGKDAQLRESRLPKLGEFRRGSTSFPVVNFDGSSCLLLVINDKGPGKLTLDSNVDLFSSQEFTMLMELSIEESPWRYVLLGAGIRTSSTSWEVSCDKGKIWLGSPAGNSKPVSVAIPAGDGLFSLSIAISNQKKEGRLTVTNSAGVTTQSELAIGLICDLPLTRLRLGAVARAKDGADNFFFRGNIAELLMYPRALSDDESRSAREYLRTKYAAAAAAATGTATSK